MRTPSKARAGRGARSALGVAVVLGCNGTDATYLTTPEPRTSRILAVLSEPESVDTLCRFVGFSTRAGLGGEAECESFVEQCRSSVGAVIELGDQVAAESEATGGEEPAPDIDLEPVLGCSVTARELDACLAQVIERGRDRYGADVTCDATELPEVELAELAFSTECLSVVLSCPELLGGP